MARISDGDLDRLKRNVSIVELCRNRGIELKKHGQRDLIGKCPFHKDKNPSFVVTPEKNLFHCMGCDAAGSVIDLIMKLDCLTFREAVDKLLASTPLIRQGPEKTEAPKQADSRKVPPERANQLFERVTVIYEKNFSEAAESKKYLESRGITDAGLFTRHRIGYSNGELCKLLPKDGQLKEELRALGIFLDSRSGEAETERFAGCVVIPVYDIDGNLTTLYGRNAGPGPKRHLFLPDRSTGMWNAVAVKTYSHIILVESVIDALSVMMAGSLNVIAIQGTNGLNDADIKLLKTYGVQKLTLLLDGDEAGGKAVARLRPRLEAQGFAVVVKALPAEDDPNSYLQKHGPEALARFLASDAWTPSEMKYESIAGAAETDASSLRAKTSSSQPAPGSSLPSCPSPSLRSLGEAGNLGGESPCVLTCGMRRYEIRGLEKSLRKLKATIRVEHCGKLHVDTLDFYSAKSRRILSMDLCRTFDEMPETIDADIEKIIRHCECLPEATTNPAAERCGTKTPEMSATEREEAETFGKSPDLFEKILADFETCGLVGEEDNKLLGYIAMTSRKRDVPLSVLILSSSGAGKTALQDAVCSFCPPEDLVKLTSLSGKALFYKERLSLKHKVLALEEGDGAEEASYAIRNLISAKELTSESTIKDLATGRLTTMENKVEGPSAVFLTTTNPEVDPETKSRFFVTSVDESREQTRKILIFQRQLHNTDELLKSPEIEAILTKHRNLQRLLKPLAVKNPYAAQLTYGDDRLQGRRDQPKYLNLIKAIAFLRQLSKEVFFENKNGTAVPFIKVDLEDLRLANRLAHEILGHSLDELSRPGRDLLDLLEKMVSERTAAIQKEESQTAAGSPIRPVISFSRRNIREYTGWSNARVHRYIKELLDLEYVLLDCGRNGMLCRYRLVYDGQGKEGQRFLLGLRDVNEITAESRIAGVE